MLHLAFQIPAAKSGRGAESLVETELPALVPTKSSAVSTVLSFVKRRPRPSCCTETVALSVGRRNRAPQRVERAA